MNGLKKLLIASMAVAALGISTEALGCATCGCSAEAVQAEKEACPPGCGKSCCAQKPKTGCCPVKAREACQTKRGCAAKVKKAGSAEIDTAALKRLLASDKKVTILDARSGKWDDKRRIPGADNLAASASAEEVGKKIPVKDALVVTYCANTECQASGKLAAHLKQLGYKNVIEYPKGIEGWEADGNEVVKVD